MNIFLSLFILALSNRHHNDTQHNKNLHSRFHDMENLFRIYNNSHGIETLMKEVVSQPSLFCSRKFVTGLDLGCDNFGNSNLKQFNGLLHAIILNRTFVIFRNISCPDTLRYKFGFPFYDEVAKLIEYASCPEHLGLYKKLTDNIYLPVINNYKLIGNDYDYFCHMDKVNQNVLSFYMVQLSPYDLFKVCNGKLGDDAIRRLNILFSHPTSLESSYFESLGYVFMKLLDFTPIVYNHINPVLHELFPGIVLSTNYHNTTFAFPKDTITIGIHIRHPAHESRDENTDKEYIVKLQEILHIYSDSYKQCRVLLASDKVSTISIISQMATSLGMIIYN